MRRTGMAAVAASDELLCALCGEAGAHVGDRDWHMPLTMSAELMSRLGEAVWRQLPDDVAVHFVVVATGGFGVGVAAAMAAAPSRLRSLTVVKPKYDFISPALSPEPGEAVVILDNSIHTGRSASRVVGHLRARDIPVTAIVTVFDAANACESEARRRLAAETGVPVLACAPWRERSTWR